MNDSQRTGTDAESLRNVVDRVIDLLTSSKSTLKILNGKETITDEKQFEAAKQHAKDLIKKKILKEFLKSNNKPDEELTEIHINEAFKSRTESNVRCSATLFNESQFEEKREPPKHRRLSMNFLDEQYNLTKQAIARRYWPQMRINTISAKSTMRDYLNEPFNQELHKIANVASEKIPTSIKKVKKKHTKKIEKNASYPAKDTPSKKTYVIYEKN